MANKQKWTSGLESPQVTRRSAANGKQTRVKRKRPATYVTVSGILVKLEAADDDKALLFINTVTPFFFAFKCATCAMMAVALI